MSDSRTSETCFQTKCVFETCPAYQQTYTSASNIQLITQTDAHQDKVIKYMSDHNVHGIVIAHEMGAGKTITSIRIAENMLKQNNNLNVIVVVSAGLIQNYYENILKVNTNIVQRFKIISRQRFIQNPFSNCNNHILIIDEAHNLKSESSQIFKIIKQCAYTAKMVLLLTGTPIFNSILDITTLYELITKVDQERVNTLRNNLTAYEQNVNNEELTNNLKQQLRGLFSFYYIDKNRIVKKRTTPVKIPATPQEIDINKSIRTLSKNLKDPLKNPFHIKEIEASIISKNLNDEQQIPIEITKYLRGTNNENNFKNLYKLCTSKTKQFIKDVLTTYNVENTKQLLFCSFVQKGIDIIKQMLNYCTIPYAEFTGDQNISQKTEAVTKYNSNIVRIFLVSLAGSEGLDLKETTHVRLLNSTYVQAQMDQIIARAIRLRSHNDIYQTVEIYQYILTSNDKNYEMIDDIVEKIKQQKNNINQQFLTNILEPVSIENDVTNVVNLVTSSSDELVRSNKRRDVVNVDSDDDEQTSSSDDSDSDDSVNIMGVGKTQSERFKTLSRKAQTFKNIKPNSQLVIQYQNCFGPKAYKNNCALHAIYCMFVISYNTWVYVTPHLCTNPDFLNTLKEFRSRKNAVHTLDDTFYDQHVLYQQQHFRENISNSDYKSLYDALIFFTSSCGKKNNIKMYDADKPFSINNYPNNFLHGDNYFITYINHYNDTRTNTTWSTAINFFDETKEDLDFKINDYTYELVNAVCFLGNNHFITFYENNRRWFKYDDLDDEGRVKQVTTATKDLFKYIAVYGSVMIHRRRRLPI